MEKTVRVLDVFIDRSSTVLHTRESDEPGDIPTALIMDRNSWVDLGMPRTITVTIEPGDTLNT